MTDRPDASVYAEFRDAMRAWCTGVLADLADALDLTRPLDRETWHKFHDSMSGSGMVDDVPRLDDGQPDLIGFAIMLEEISRIDGSLPWFFIESLLQPEILRGMLDDEGRERFAHLLRPGVHISGAISEPDTGSDPDGMRTVARRDGDDWLINGRKMWISGANVADALILYCRLRSDDDSTSPGAFVLEHGAGYAVRPISMLGTRGHALCEVEFDDVRVSDAARLSRDGSARSSMGAMLARTRCLLAMIGVGLAQHALDSTVEYTKARVQFGRPIGGFQLIQEMLSTMATDVLLGRLLAYRALETVESGSPQGVVEASMAKGWCTEMSVRVASTAVQAHGAIGLSEEHHIARILRDARMLTVPDGTTQIHHLIVGRSLTGISALR